MFRRLNWFALILIAAGPAHGGLIGDRAALHGILGGNAVEEDFESYAVGDGISDSAFGLGVLDSTTISNGQGPSLVEPGATYVSGDGSSVNNFSWQGDGYLSLPTKTIVAFIAANIPTTLTISYDTPVIAMGVDLYDYDLFSHTTTISVFDDGGGLIESFDFSIDGSAGVFFGYESSAIGSVKFTGNPLGWASIIDNHSYGVPEPATVSLLMISGLLIYGWRRCRRADIPLAKRVTCGPLKCDADEEP